MNQFEATALLDTVQHVSGNARTRARTAILDALQASGAPLAEWQVEREELERAITRLRDSDARVSTMLAECRKALVAMTAERDALAAQQTVRRK